MSSEPPAHPVELAAVTKPQGLRGEVALQLFNPRSELWQAGRRFWAAGEGTGRWVTLEGFSVRNRGAVVKLAGVSSREAAEGLVGCRLSVDRAELPALGDRELYLADLMGMTVLDADGKKVGVVVALEEGGKQDFLVIEGSGRRELLPVESELLASIDAERRTLTLSIAAE
ncbi:MAG: ribosome maturation factor RimM [Myxococcales bacterium]